MFESANISQMTSQACAIGVDFGTASARTLLLDLRSGEELALCELAYPHGVIDDMLPETGERLPLDWALHDPDDYRFVLEAGIQGVLSERPDAATSVVGIGIDATSCTVLPVTADGTPLCELPMWRTRPHAWPKLWKHHAAQHVANRLNEVAVERKEAFLARYGGRISSEWYFPKLIEIWLEDRGVYDALHRLCRGGGLARVVSEWTRATFSLPGRLQGALVGADGVPGADLLRRRLPGFLSAGSQTGPHLLPLGSSAGRSGPTWLAKWACPKAWRWRWATSTRSSRSPGPGRRALALT